MAQAAEQNKGLTLLAPIQSGPDQGPSYADQIRQALAQWDNGVRSPLAKVGGLHMARLAVVDDVFYQAAPSHEDHLRCEYLFFNANFDGDADFFLNRLVQDAPEEVQLVWGHCINFPGNGDGAAMRDYLKRCQIENVIHFADYPEATLPSVLRALRVQRDLIAMIADNQGRPAAELKQAFAEFMTRSAAAGAPAPGSM